MPVKLDGEKVDRCPMRPYLDDPGGFNELMERHRWAKAGNFLDPGGLLDQATQFVECSGVIEAAMDEAERVRRERDDRTKKVVEKAGREGGRRGRRR